MVEGCDEGDRGESGNRLLPFNALWTFLIRIFKAKLKKWRFFFKKAAAPPRR